MIEEINTILEEIDTSSSLFLDNLPKDETVRTDGLIFGDAIRGEQTYDDKFSNVLRHTFMKKWVFTNEFEYQLAQKQSHDGIDISLDYVFNTIDGKLLNNEYDLCNNLLGALNVSDYNINILIGILTITLNSKDKLILREVFYQNVKNLIYRNYNISEANIILEGLE